MHNSCHSKYFYSITPCSRSFHDNLKLSRGGFLIIWGLFSQCDLTLRFDSPPCDTTSCLRIFILKCHDFQFLSFQGSTIMDEMFRNFLTLFRNLKWLRFKKLLELEQLLGLLNRYNFTNPFFSTFSRLGLTNQCSSCFFN